MSFSLAEPSTVGSGPAPQPAGRRRTSRRTLGKVAAAAAIGVPLGVGATQLRAPGGMTFAGATAWLNSESLGPALLRDRVVLVNFWTFTCINWMRTAPYLRAWAQSYRDDGLVVVGVHTPEFSFEHDIEAVRRQVRERGIRYAVAMDNDYAIWTEFDNHYWPALYVLDGEGIIQHRHFGEGDYQETERALQGLLGVDRAMAAVVGDGDEADADWGNLRSAEMYLGHDRSTDFTPDSPQVLDASSSFSLPPALLLNNWALEGEWTISREKVTLDRTGGGIAVRFHARDAHLVLSSDSGQPITFKVLLDGEPPGRAAASDIDPAGYGVLRDGRMYQLIREPDIVGDRVLQITFSRPGAEAYAFTFG